jgi:1-acyl-sn-glycerol-3-phosphate acyltransferase
MPYTALSAPKSLRAIVRKPSWPASVPYPPVERKTGTAFDTAWARRYGVRLARAVVLDGVTRPLLQAVASPAVNGLDRIDQLQAPAIFAANHASHLDTPLMLASLPERFRHRTAVGAGADYFFDKRWKGALWAFAINAIPIERTRPSVQSVRLAVSLIEEGWSLVLFPEGGRTPHGWGQEHHPGAAYLAIRTGVPVVPVHIEGTGRILGRGAKTLTPGSATVTVGSPMTPDPDEDARAFAARIEQAVAVLADEQATDWWTARKRAAANTTPALTGPDAGAWRRSWALPAQRTWHTRGGEPAWPKL